MFQASRFIRDHFGEPSSVVRFIKSYGRKPPSEAAVYKWTSRNSMSSDWLALLVVLLEIEHCKPISLRDYYEEAAA